MIVIDFNEVKRLYFEEHQSTLKIAKLFNCSVATIWRLFDKNNVSTNRSEILKHYVKTDKHKNNISKAKKGNTFISDEQKEKMRIGMLEAVKRGHSGCFKKGHKPNITPERNEKISLTSFGVRKPKYSGEKHWMWRGGKQIPMAQRTCEKSWKYTKLQVLKRDGGKCRECGKNEKDMIDVHHIIPWKISHDDSMGNLITLCRSCHGKEEWRIRKSA